MANRFWQQTPYNGRFCYYDDTTKSIIWNDGWLVRQKEYDKKGLIEKFWERDIAWVNNFGKVYGGKGYEYKIFGCKPSPQPHSIEMMEHAFDGEINFEYTKNFVNYLLSKKIDEMFNRLLTSKQLN